MIDFEKRKSYIGGSDCSAVVGMNRWNSPLGVWAEKTGQVEPKVLDSIAVDLGRELEDYVARRFTKETGKKVRRVNTTIMHPKYSFIGANIDRMVDGEESILEAKTASAWKQKEWAGEEVPQEYELQCHHYMMVTGKKKCYLAVLLGNQDFIIKEINRDEKLIKAMEQKEVDFWQKFVVPKVMPTVIKANDGDTLQELFAGKVIPDPIELTDEANQLVETIQANNQDLMSLKNDIDRNKNELKALLGEHEIGETGLWRISWREQTRNSIDTKRLQKEKPEIYKEYIKPSVSRVLRMTQKESE